MILHWIHHRCMKESIITSVEKKHIWYLGPPPPPPQKKKNFFWWLGTVLTCHIIRKLFSKRIHPLATAKGLKNHDPSRIQPPVHRVQTADFTSSVSQEWMSHMTCWLSRWHSLPWGQQCNREAAEQTTKTPSQTRNNAWPSWRKRKKLCQLEAWLGRDLLIEILQAAFCRIPNWQ